MSLTGAATGSELKAVRPLGRRAKARNGRGISVVPLVRLKGPRRARSSPLLMRTAAPALAAAVKMLVTALGASARRPDLRGGITASRSRSSWPRHPALRLDRRLLSQTKPDAAATSAKIG